MTSSYFRLPLVLLLLALAAPVEAQSVVYYQELIYTGNGTDQCAIGPIYGDSPATVAQLITAKNNAITSCVPGSPCFDPVTLVNVTETTYTVESTCWGTQFTHPIRKIINPKQDPLYCCVSNPVNPTYGAKYQEELDYPGTSAGHLKLIRYYNSAADTEGASGVGATWTHGYLRRLSVIIGNASNPVPYDATFARRPNGQVLAFKKVSGAWVADADLVVSLVDVLNASSQVIGYRLTIGNSDEVEDYNLQGRLTSIKNREGLQETLTYSDGTSGANGGFVLDANGNPTSTVLPAGILIRVTDFAARTLQFGYDSARRLVKATDPNAGVFRYQYGANNNLATVTYPDTKTREYVYNEPANTSGANLPRALTGIIDENTARFATYQYDAQGRAISTQHAGGADLHSLAYTVDASGNPVSTDVTDPRGTVRTYSFQSVLGAVKETARSLPGSGGALAVTHDANGNVASRTDFNGNRTNFTYDLARNLETTRTEGLTPGEGTTPQTRTISTQWHSTFRLATAVAEPLRITTNTYDPDGTTCGARGALCSRSVQATTDADGSQGFSATASGSPRVWTYSYNSNGLVLTVNGPRTDVTDTTTYTYYANNDVDPGKRGNVATITNAAGHATSITAYNGHGQPLTIVDPNGLTTTMVYDARQRLTSRSVGSEATLHTYDGVGQLTRMTLPDGSYLNYDYDDAHRLTSLQDNLGNKITYTLDASGNRTAEEVRDPSNTLAQTRSRVFNSLNRLFQELGATSQTTEYAYDDQGNVVSVKDPLNKVTANQYDALNRLKQVTDPGTGVTQYGYNGLNALVSVSDPRSLVTGYTVDGLGNLTQQQSPDTGSTVNTYDAAGNPLTQTDAKGQATTYAHDMLNRVTLITFHDGSKQQYVYDAGTNGIGRLSSITERDPANQQTNKTSYTYDQHGRVLAIDTEHSGVTYSVGYTYDSAGRLSVLTYPSGRTVTYHRDGLGRVDQAFTAKNGQTNAVLYGVSYHPFGGVKSYTFANGQVYDRGIDQDGRIASYTLGPKSFAIGYDAASRIAFISDVAVPANSNTYDYDNLDRLTSAVTPSTPFAYTYDAVGNRTSRTAGSSTDAYTYSTTSNRIATVGSRTFSFDANGSTTGDGNNTYAYDTRGRMVQATSVLGATDYKVNALGQRNRKTNSLGDTVFHYDTGGRLIAETDPAGTLKREYFYLGDIPVAVLAQ